MSRVYSTGGQIYFKDSAGKIIWSTQTRPINLLPDSNKITVPITVSFPDFQKGNAYGLSKPSSDRTSCVSFGTILPGEYGPTASGIYNLPDILLGTIPATVNYIDVSVNIRRTKEPSPFLQEVVPKIMTENANVFLPGGSCLVESTSVFNRLFEIVRIGNNIYLRRYQSIRDNGDLGIWNPDNSIYQNGVPYRAGWTYGVSPKGQFATLLDAKGPSGNIAKYRGGSNGCSLSDSSNFSSVWAGTAIITPGRYNG